MKVYALKHSEDYIGECCFCNWDVATLYYDNKEAMHRDLKRILDGQEPREGLCAECFLDAVAEVYTPTEA